MELAVWGNYALDREGNVYHIGKKKLTPRKLYKEDQGYYKFSYYKPGNHYSAARVHRVMWEAWYGPLKQDEDVHHNDEDKENNHLDNLVKMTHSEHARLTRRNQIESIQG